MGPRHHLSFCACNTAWLAPELHVSMGPSPLCGFKTAPFGALGPTPHLSFCPCKSAWLVPEILVSVVFCDAPEIQSLWVPLLDKTESRVQVSAGVPDPTCRFVHAKQRDFAPELLLSMGCSSHLWFCACKTATLGLEIQSLLVNRLHLWILHAKQRLLDQNNKSLWVPDFTCDFVQSKQRD